MLCKAVKLILIALLIPVFALAQEKVDINTATLEQLDTLTGIGPVYAQRIIDTRPFSSVDDLIKVSGIGEKTLQKIKDQGLAYVEYVETPEATTQEEPPKEEKVAEDEPLQLSYPEGIFISKIMPSPKGADVDNEYIELKNTNNFEVDLTDWIIRDKQGSIKEYLLKEKISALGVLTLLRPKTKITLNNDGDGLELLNPLREIVDFVDFGKAETGIAFIKTSSGWRWDISTSTEEKAIEIRSLQTAEKEPLQTQVKKGAEIDLSASSPKSNISIYLTAFLVAFMSSVIFFILKKKLYRDHTDITV